MNNRDRVELGIKGEDIAADYLREKGYDILCRNYRIGHSDIDILARESDTLVFVEVRTKLKIDRGMPEETITYRKLQQMKQTAGYYLAINRIESPARLDALCIVLDTTSAIKHLEHYIGVGQM